ncbi:hypothetical protein [Paramagnetospirillum marisnigri]|nr:hypothetical protein [Paramagnetospirillum marisnigri]
MNVALIVVGEIVTLIALISGFGSDPISAPQQAVQRLDFVIAMLGMVVTGLGVIAGKIKTAGAESELRTAANSKPCPACGANCPITAPMCGSCDHNFNAKS